MITKGLYTSQYVGMSDPTIKCTFEWDMYSEGSTRLNDDQILVHSWLIYSRDSSKTSMSSPPLCQMVIK